MGKAAFLDIKFAWRKESLGRIRWVTTAEEDALEAYLMNRGRPEPEAVWDLIVIALETGCRRAELLTVEPDQINGTRLHLWKTKTDSPRTIPMTQETTDRLRRLVTTGRMPTERSLRSWWERAKVSMGLSGDDQFVFHVCRHTCATRMVERGVNLLVIKEWMGHKRIETTQRYAHVKPDNLDAALLLMGKPRINTYENSSNSANKSVPHKPKSLGGLTQVSASA